MGNKKKGSLEKIYTPESLSNMIIDRAAEWYDYNNISEILEPAAGNGKMLDVIYNRFPSINVLAYDIFNEEHRSDIIECNYLKHKINYKKGRIAIMNPPFTNGIKFVYKAMSECDYVISILSANSWITFDYDKYNDFEVEKILINKKQKFENDIYVGICVMFIRRK